MLPLRRAAAGVTPSAAPAVTPDPRAAPRPVVRGEFDLIASSPAPPRAAAPGVVLGIGDDAAVLAPAAGEELVATADAVVEGVHFDGGFTPEDVGWKALAVNLSDLAAMGARPRWALVRAGRAARRAAARGSRASARGLAACARRYGIALVGGNVTRARELSRHGDRARRGAAAGRALLRGGARPGDLLSRLRARSATPRSGSRRRAAPALARRQRRPTPRLALGLRARAALASAGLDVSDGLVQDLGPPLPRVRRRGARCSSALPLRAVPPRAARRAARALARARGRRGLRAPLRGAAARGVAALAALAAARAAWRSPTSARFVRGRGVRVSLDAAGRTYTVRATGHDHLR